MLLRLSQLVATMLILGSVQGVLSQETLEKNPFADPDMEPSYRPQCHEVRELTKDREIYVTTRGGIVARSVLKTDPLRLGEPVSLFTPPLTPRGSFFHVSADGQRFLFATERLTADARRFHLAIDWVP